MFWLLVGLGCGGYDFVDVVGCSGRAAVAGGAEVHGFVVEAELSSFGFVFETGGVGALYVDGVEDDGEGHVCYQADREELSEV